VRFGLYRGVKIMITRRGLLGAICVSAVATGTGTSVLAQAQPAYGPDLISLVQKMIGANDNIRVANDNMRALTAVEKQAVLNLVRTRAVAATGGELLASRLAFMGGTGLAVLGIGAAAYAVIDPQGFMRLVKKYTGQFSSWLDLPKNHITQMGGAVALRSSFTPWMVGQPYPDLPAPWVRTWNNFDYSDQVHIRPNTTVDNVLADPIALPATQPIAEVLPELAPAERLAMADKLLQRSISKVAADALPSLQLALDFAIPDGPDMPLAAWQNATRNDLLAVWPDPAINPATNAPPYAASNPNPNPNPNPTPQAIDWGVFQPPDLTVPEPKAWWDAWEDGIKNLLPKIPPHNVSCPTLSLNFFGTQTTITSHCAPIAQMKPTLRLVETIVAGLAALFVIMEA
jgi:hypothetical protein